MPNRTSQIDDDREVLAVEELQRRVDGLRGTACIDCGTLLCGHAAIFSVALGFQNAPHCAHCLATKMDRPLPELRDHLWDHIQRRECYRTVWQVENARESFVGELPGCLWSDTGDTLSADPHFPDKATQEAMQEAITSAVPPPFDAEWNAGDMGCGDLVLALRMRLKALPPAAVLKLTATDPGAPEDIPAWCRLTGHALVGARHPDYFIQRKEQ